MAGYEGEGRTFPFMLSVYPYTSGVRKFSRRVTV